MCIQMGQQSSGGTGLTRAQVNEAIDYLANQLQAGGLQRVLCVPASDQSASEAAFRGVPLTSLQAHPQVSTASMCSLGSQTQHVPRTNTRARLKRGR